MGNVDVENECRHAADTMELINPQPEDSNDQIGAGLRKLMNTHGHGFQYALMRRGEELYRNKQSYWALNAAEFPVVVGEASTHIDFVLEYRSRNAFLIAECKRADPARARWCFVRAPYTWRNASDNRIFLEQFVCRPLNIVIPTIVAPQTEFGPYHIGVELRTGATGDGVVTDHGRSGIDKAVAQVLRGTSGLINHFLSPSRRLFSAESALTFIPAVFTTAEIWVTDADLGASSLESGDLPTGSTAAKQADWIWYTHNRSPTLGPDTYEPHTFESDLGQALRREFARSVAIISTKGIDRFLGIDIEAWLP